MALTQYIKKWKWNEHKIDFEVFIQNFINDSSSVHCFIVSSTVTYYLDGVAMEGFFIYEYRT